MSFSFNFGADDLVEGHETRNGHEYAQETVKEAVDQPAAVLGPKANGSGSAKAHTLPEMVSDACSLVKLID